MVAKSIKWRTQFSAYKADDYGLTCPEPSRTLQAEKNMFNPNFIIRQYWRDGDINVFNQRKGIFADISGLGSMSSFADVQSRLNAVSDAFMTLPALEREKFGNDPIVWLDFANNPANIKWMQDFGFLPRDADRSLEEVKDVKSAGSQVDPGVVA